MAIFLHLKQIKTQVIQLKLYLRQKLLNFKWPNVIPISLPFKLKSLWMKMSKPLPIKTRGI